MMLFWRIWYVRNELVHSKPLPHVHVSVQFLGSYLESLQGIKESTNINQVKGKSVVRPDYIQKVCSLDVSWTVYGCIMDKASSLKDKVEH